MAIKRVKPNYMSAVSKTPPAGKIVIPSSHMEELDRAIRQKVRQNEAERAASMEVAFFFLFVRHGRALMVKVPNAPGDPCVKRM